MAQPEYAATMMQWMEQFTEATLDDRVIETSAGAGPQHEFAYLHFRTVDGEHVALVLRAVLVDGRPEIRVVPIDAGAEGIRDIFNTATHGEVAA